MRKVILAAALAAFVAPAFAADGKQFWYSYSLPDGTVRRSVVPFPMVSAEACQQAKISYLSGAWAQGFKSAGLSVDAGCE